MTDTLSTNGERKVPTYTEAILFRLKSSLLQLRRAVLDFSNPELRRAKFDTKLSGSPVLADSVTKLWSESDPGERHLVAGKIQNLRLAANRLNGLEVEPGQIFSFWRQMGRATRFRRFVAGRELREGCIIPSIGGGLCQISNALYDAALRSGFEIVERHAHSEVIPGSLAEESRDATVFWNYVDLRFRSSRPFRIEAEMDADDLIVRFRGDRTEKKDLRPLKPIAAQNGGPNNCLTCGANDCFRAAKPSGNNNFFGRTAYLVDEFSAEFDAYIQKERVGSDVLLLPLDGARLKKANYAWTTAGFAKIHQSLPVTVHRSYRSRRLAAQGAKRQLNLLDMYERLAASYAKRLKFDVLHIVVQQNLLPFLWRSGDLGGRTFDVLMNALPMSELQKRLDLAYSLHPESKTLADFRADESLIAAESEALKRARKIITPHTGIASLFGDRAVPLDWKMTGARERTRPKNKKPRIVLPSSTVGRKGCYELREAICGVDVTIVTLGGDIEGSEFWRGYDVERGGQNWMDRADVVVLPAFVEHRPGRLLQAAAAGIPVIASKACGVEGVDGIETLDWGDVEGLRAAIKRKLVNAEVRL